MEDSFNNMEDSFNNMEDSFNNIEDSFNNMEDSFNLCMYLSQQVSASGEGSAGCG